MVRIIGEYPEEDLVQGAWTKFTSYAARVSGPAIASLTSETLPDYVDRLREIDLPRQDRIRKRVHDTVKNPEFADSLTPWYPDWCKRP
jgi:cation diffusion facilitator CzcD-associated flavoprotein CzcO